MDHWGAEADQMQAVTYHAVTRYVQRVLHVDVEGIVPDMSPLDEAKAHCEAADTTIAAVRRQILSPAVLVAMRVKCPIVVGAGYRVVLSPDRSVVLTIVPAAESRRVLIMDRTESRRRGRKVLIKRNGRPTALNYGSRQ